MGIALSVVIPAYNEEHRLGPTLERVATYLRERGITWELIAVDDGSKDGTSAVIDAASARWPEIVRITAPRNRGKGAAVREGVRAAVGELILFSDADLSTPIEEVEKLEAALARSPAIGIAIGSRGLAASEIEVRQSRGREIMGRVFNRIVRALVVGGIRDTQCGFKLFRRDVAHDLFGRAKVDGFAFDVEVLWLAQGRTEVAEVPVVWRHVDESKVSPGSDAARMFVDILRIRRLHK
jgi:dolichyl-phosphate beta-glucosyltransferase